MNYFVKQLLARQRKYSLLSADVICKPAYINFECEQVFWIFYLAAKGIQISNYKKTVGWEGKLHQAKGNCQWKQWKHPLIQEDTMILITLKSYSI